MAHSEVATLSTTTPLTRWDGKGAGMGGEVLEAVATVAAAAAKGEAK